MMGIDQDRRNIQYQWTRHAAAQPDSEAFHKGKLILSDSELVNREKIELSSFDAIEHFDRENPETINWQDVVDVLAIQNDSRQRHRFDQVKETPEEFYNDVVMDEKVRIHFVRDPETNKPISTLSITLVRGDQLETWAEHGATDIEYHGRGIFSQLFEGALYETFQQKAFGQKFNENIHGGVIIDGDHGPIIKTLYRLGFVPILRHKDQMGNPTDADRITQVVARKQQGLEKRFDTVRFKLPVSNFIIGCLHGNYPFLDRTGKSEELLQQARQDGVYFESLRIENNEHIRQINISHEIRDILDPIGL